LWSSPLLALHAKDPFDRYIFCESNVEALDALRVRVKKLFPHADVCYVASDCNKEVEAICRNIPTPSRDKKVLSFCFVDPYDLSVRFSTIRQISERFVDFLILLALGMDANRNLQHYLDPMNQKLDEFLGLRDWRDRWLQASLKVRSDVRNLPLYHLALFSRHTLAYDLWEDVLRYSNSQSSFSY